MALVPLFLSIYIVYFVFFCLFCLINQEDGVAVEERKRQETRQCLWAQYVTSRDASDTSFIQLLGIGYILISFSFSLIIDVTSTNWQSWFNLNKLVQELIWLGYCVTGLWIEWNGISVSFIIIFLISITFLRNNES